MKRFLMGAAFAALVASQAMADNHTYTYQYYDEDWEEYFPFTGMLRRTSPNGRFAVGGDDDEMWGGYIVDTDEPEEIFFTPDGVLLDVNDEGLAVGAWYERPGIGVVYQRAAIFSDHEWKQLPVPEEIMLSETTIGRSYAVAISADSRRIAGHAMCRNEDPELPGRYFPLVWKLNEATGEYEVEKLYNGLWLPGTNGFFMQAMSPDGRYLFGEQHLDFGDIIAAMLDLETGEYKIWHNIEIRDWWFENPGGYYPTMFVDGVMDGWNGEEDYFMGRFLYATDRYAFGSRSTVSDVNEETGEGTVTSCPAVYDFQNGEWTDGDAEYGMFMCGTSPEEVFTSTGEIIQNGVAKTVDSVVKGTDKVSGIYGFDNSGKIWVGSQVILSPLGDLVESPVLVMLQEPGLSEVKTVATASHQPKISLDGRTITIENALKADIYSADGLHISSSKSVTVAPGYYIVVADKRTYKLIVK